MSEPLSTDRTFFSAGTRIEGTLELDGEVKLEGQVKGKVSGTGVVTIGEHANLQADVFAPTIIIHGIVRGEIHATDRIELHRSAKVKGVIHTPRIRIDDGAVFEGECRMGPQDAKPEPVKAEAAKPEERRSAPPAASPPAAAPAGVEVKRAAPR
ncbi:MAG: polymer-forming cytoskeletal protein [Deltaproteobacteria bacterium]|nr:polymer-forming cytoskeletal protein [Deltaproteobacteria bacterium]